MQVRGGGEAGHAPAVRGEPRQPDDAHDGPRGPRRPLPLAQRRGQPVRARAVIFCFRLMATRGGLRRAPRTASRQCAWLILARDVWYVLPLLTVCRCSCSSLGNPTRQQASCSPLRLECSCLGKTNLRCLCRPRGPVACVVDSTFATPYHVNPLRFKGIGAVIQSATKYLRQRNCTSSCAPLVLAYPALLMRFLPPPLPRGAREHSTERMRTADIRIPATSCIRGSLVVCCVFSSSRGPAPASTTAAAQELAPELGSALGSALAAVPGSGSRQAAACRMQLLCKPPQC